MSLAGGRAGGQRVRATLARRACVRAPCVCACSASASADVRAWVAGTSLPRARETERERLRAQGDCPGEREREFRLVDLNLSLCIHTATTTTHAKKQPSPPIDDGAQPERLACIPRVILQHQATAARALSATARPLACPWTALGEK